MEDLNGLEAVIRRIAREEIARAVGAAGAVAGEVWSDAPEDSAKEASADVLRRTMERVARDVLADKHPALSTEHASDPAPFCMEFCHACGTHTNRGHLGGPCPVEHASTEPVHTITTVPERSRAACTCHRHTHVMGQDDRCGAPFCYCLSPVRARAEHTDEHASTEVPRTCSVCEHGEHDQGKCTMHVYLRGVPSPCPCLASRTLGAQPRTGTAEPVPCAVCKHGKHVGRCPEFTGRGQCGCRTWPNEGALS